MKRQSWTLGIQKRAQMDLEQNMNGMHDFGEIILDFMDLEQNKWTEWNMKGAQ